MQTARIALLACLAAFLQAGALLAADSGQIAFLHLRWDSNQVTLVRTDLRPGHLKPGPPLAAGGARVQLADAQGRAVWQSAMTDPRVRRYEYPAGASSGALATHTVTVASAESVIRVPVHASAAEILLLGPASASAGPAAAGLPAVPSTNLVVLARFPAPRAPKTP